MHLLAPGLVQTAVAAVHVVHLVARPVVVVHTAVVAVHVVANTAVDAVPTIVEPVVCSLYHVLEAVVSFAS